MLGEKGGPIRYYLKTRHENGEPKGDGNGLAPGLYKLKIYVEDINGIGAEWPRYLHPDSKNENFEHDDFILIDVVAFGIPPQITIIEPVGGTYYKNDFNIIASAAVQGDLDTDIDELCFEITGGVDRQGNKLPIIRTQNGGPIILARYEGSHITNGAFKEFTVEVGATYYTTDASDVAVKLESGQSLPPNWKTNVTLIDGSYNINVYARGDAHSKHTETRTIYIDRNPPRTDISRVSPAFRQEASAFTTYPHDVKEEYRVFTVNKSIQIDVSSTDTFGSAYEENGFTKFKYMLLTQDIPGSNNVINDTLNLENGEFSREKYILNYIYGNGNAKYLDDGKNQAITEGSEPVISIKEDGGAYSIIIRTHLYQPNPSHLLGPQYDLWLYISALDGAGNPNFQKIHLIVNQDTDKPRITFGNINAKGSPHGYTFMDELFHIRFTVLDDNGLAEDAIQIRYAIDENTSLSAAYEEGWYDLQGTPSSDFLSISIDNLNLLRIACFRLGHTQSNCTLDDSHKGILGLENIVKFIQIRAKDDPKTKLYESDGTSWGDTEWRPFRLDLTKPKIVPSTHDASGLIPITREDDNPFVSPVKEGSYRDDLHFAYGDIKEQNLRTISVKINGNEVIKYPKEYLDTNTGEWILPDMEGLILGFNEQLPNDNTIAVWRSKGSGWEGELRFRIPIGDLIAALPDGSHSFEITIEDKALQYDTRSITIYKDLVGPEVSLIVPSVNYEAIDTNVENIPPYNYGQLQGSRLKDISAKIIGSFNDRYSSIFNNTNSMFQYKINNGIWNDFHITQADDYNKSYITWEIVLPEEKDLPDGTHFLSIRVKDIHGNLTEKSNLVFMLDRSQPTLTISSIELDDKLISGSYRQGFTVKGTVKNTFGFENGDFHVLVNQNSKDKIGDQFKTADREFEFEYFVVTEGVPSVNDGYLADFKYGPNTILFNVTGSSGQSAIATGNITLDNKGPDVTFNTTGGEKITLTPANINTINTTNAAGWTDSNLEILYMNRVKDRSAFAKLSGRFTDEYTPIPEKGSGGSFTFGYEITKTDGSHYRSSSGTSSAATEESTSAGWDIAIPHDMPDGVYFLSIHVDDRAGNESTAGQNMAFMIDRSIPEISIFIPGGNNDEYDVFNATEMNNKTVDITVTNTYEVQSLAFILNDTARNVEIVPTSSLKTFIYRYTFLNAAGLIHGLQNISIAATGSSDQTRNAGRGFSLDIKAPEILISGKEKIYESQFNAGTVSSHNTGLDNGTENPRDWNNSAASVYHARLKDTAEKLTLNFTDDLSPIKSDSLEYRINSTGTWNSLPLTMSDNGRNASADVPWSSSYRDGLNTLNVRISDTKSNQTPDNVYIENIVFMVDTKVPSFRATDDTSTVTGIKVNEVFSGDHTITIKGVVRNVYDVSRLGLIVNAEEKEVQGTEVDHYLNFVPDVPDSKKSGFPFEFNVSTNEFNHGTQSIIINAIGSSGKSTMISYNVIVDKEGPSIKFSTTDSPIYIRNSSDIVGIHGYAYGVGTINSTQQNYYKEIYAARITDTGAKLTGTFTDEHSEIFSTGLHGDYGYWYKIDRINAAGDALTEGFWMWEHVSNPPANNFANWQINLDSTYPDGLYRLSMRVTDRLGNGASDSSSTPASPPAAPDDNPDSGKGYQNNMTFMLDRTPPVLTIASVSQGKGPGTYDQLKGFYVTGSVSNTFKVDGFQVIVAQNEKTTIGNSFPNVGDIPRKGSFNFDYWIQMDNDTSFTYGPNTIVLNATGSSGQSDMKTTSTILDNRGPEISFNTTGGQKVYVSDTLYGTLNGANISNIAWTAYRNNLYDTRVKDSSATAKLTGRFTDDYTAIPHDNGKYTFRYRITGDSVWNGVSSNIDWKTIEMISSLIDSKSVPWEIALPVSMPDGIYRLSIAVKDRNDYGSDGITNTLPIEGINYGYEADMAFMVDRKAPNISITGLTEGGLFNNSSNISFTGTVTDTYEVKGLSMTINGGASVTLPFVDSGAKSFNITNKVLQDAGVELDHGRQNIVISVIGSSDQVSNVPYNFVVDKEGPIVSIRGKNKILESVLGESVSSLNTGLTTGDNPNVWSDLKALIFNERLNDVNTKLTLNFVDDFSTINGSTLTYSINSVNLGNLSLYDVRDNGRNALVDIPWSVKNGDNSNRYRDGLNTLSVWVNDEMGNPASDQMNIVFMVDMKTPVLSVTDGISQNAVLGGNNNIIIKGTISDVYDVNRLSLLLNGTEIAAMGSEVEYASLPSDTINYNIVPMGSYFNFTLMLPKEALHHGTQSVLISAIGTSGKSKMNSYNIVIDSEGPKITFNTAASDLSSGKPIYLSDADIIAIHNYANYSSGTLTSEQADKYLLLGTATITDLTGRLMGSFADDYSEVFARISAEGVTPIEIDAGYWYKLDMISNDALVQGTWTWVPFTGNTDSRSQSWQLNLPQNFADGIYRLSMRVKDRLGNGYGANDTIPGMDANGDGGGGYEQNMAFIVERGIPEIQVTSHSFNTPFFANKDFTITGKITNTSFINSLTLKIGNNAAVPITWADSGGSKEFTFSATVNTSALAETSHSISITVIGASLQSNSANGNFTFDKTPPLASIIVPTLGTSQSGSLTLPSGTFANGRYSITLSQAWVYGKSRISGNTEDESGISKIYYHFGKLSNNITDGNSVSERETYYSNADWQDTGLDGENRAPDWSGGLYYWHYEGDLDRFENITNLIEDDVDPLEEPTSGPNSRAFYLPLYIKTVDIAGNINVIHYKLKVDPDIDRPNAAIGNPEQNQTVGGEIRVTGSADDLDCVHSVEIRIIPQQFWNDRNNFTEINSTPYYKNVGDEWVYGANPSSPDDAGWVKAKIQGNIDVVVSWYYNINGDGLLSPPVGVLRPVTIQVRAIDTKNRIDPDKKGRNQTRAINFDSTVPTISVPIILQDGTTREYSEGIRLSKTFTINVDVEDEGGISSIKAIQNGMPAQKEIVRNGLVQDTNLESGWTVTTPALKNQSQWVVGYRYYIINPGSLSLLQWQAIDVDASITTKTYTAGTMFKYKGGAPAGTATAYEAVGTQANTTTDLSDPNTDNWNSQRFKYSLSFTVDSINLPNLEYGKTGNYNLVIDVEDNNSPITYKTRGNYTMGIDNFYPSTTITTHYNASTANFYVSGVAKDYDDQGSSVQGLAHMLVYFSRLITNTFVYKGTTLPASGALPTNTRVYFNPRGVPIGYLNTSNTFVSFNQTDASYSTGFSSEWHTIPVMTTRSNVMDKTLAPASPNANAPNVSEFRSFPLLKIRAKGGNIGNVWESPHAMVINSPELGATVDTDGDLTFAEMWQGVADKEWQARFDTNYFVDGPVDVHYMIMDEAGNSTHYTKRIYIGNNRPLIRDLNLGTDMGRRGTISTNDKTNSTWGTPTAPILNYDNARGWGDRLRNSLVINEGGTNATDFTSNRGFLETGFRIRNYAFNLVLNTLYGNGQKRYRVTYTNRELITASGIIEGQCYTIYSPGNVDWRLYGALDNIVGTTFVATAVPETTATGQVYRYVLPAVDTQVPANTAALPPSNTGTLAANIERAGNITGDYIDDIIFNNFTNINDSIKVTTETPDRGEILSANRNQRYFLVKVYDTTVSGGTEVEQLAHAVALALDIDNEDGKRPVIAVSPFHWTSASNNSLYNNSRANGHIELEADLPTGTGNFGTSATGINDLDPKVSGQVSIRGTSSDNNVIQDINFRITNHVQQTAQQTDSVTIAPNTYYRAGTYTNGAWNVPVGPFTSSNQDNSVYNASGWKFVIESEVLDMDGHRINWRLDFDSSFITDNASADNVFTVVARDSLNDSNPRTWANNLQTAAVKTEHYRFDVVPYIREVVTPLSLAYKTATSAFNRSATGWYPVRDSKTTAEKIGIKGFNLNGTSTTITVNNTALTATAIAVAGATDDLYNASTSSAKTHIVARLDNDNDGSNVSTITSGALIVTVNGQASLNNRNMNDAEYNKEPNNTNNNILNDDRNMYVWSVGSLLNRTTDITLESPSFRVSESGKRLLAHANYTGNPGRVILHDNVASITQRGTIIESNLNRYAFVTVGVDTGVTGTNEDHWYIGANNQTSNGRTAFNLHSRGATFYTSNNESSYGNMYPGHFKTRILGNRWPSDSGSDSTRIRMIKIHSRSTGANTSNVTISYGDTLRSNKINLHYGTANGALNTSNPIFGGDLVPAPSTNQTIANMSNGSDGTNYGYDWDTQYPPVPTGTFTWQNARPYAARINEVTRTDSAHKGSIYSAAVSLANRTNTATHIPVVAWFDENAGNLLISYGNTDSHTNLTSHEAWQGRATVVQTNAGAFVDMAVDGANNIHLAYYDGNGGLMYAHIPNDAFTFTTNNATRTQVGTIRTVRVDTFLSAGLKIMLNIRTEVHSGVTRYVPYISYWHGAFPETKFTVRTAWPVRFDTNGYPTLQGTDDEDRFEGNWEVMTVPVENTPLSFSAYNELIVANGVPRTATNWRTPTGTGALNAGDYTNNNGSARINRTILVGYMTFNHYEGAVLKRDLWPGQ